MYNQISIKEYLDPFKDKNKQYKYQKHTSMRQKDKLKIYIYSLYYI